MKAIGIVAFMLAAVLACSNVMEPGDGTNNMPVSYRVESSNDSIVVRYLDSHDQLIQEAVYPPWQIDLDKRIGTLAYLTGFKTEETGWLRIIVIINGHEYRKYTEQPWGWVHFEEIVE